MLRRARGKATEWILRAALRELPRVPDSERVGLAHHFLEELGGKRLADLLSQVVQELPPKMQHFIGEAIWKSLLAGPEPIYAKRLAKLMASTVETSKLARALCFELYAKMSAGFLVSSLQQGWKRLSQEEQIQLRAELRNTVTLDYPGAEIQIYCDSPIEYQTRSHSASKEPELVDWIENTFLPGDVFYDIGANVGAYSLIAAAKHRNRIHVVAFEPSYPSFSQLAANILLNHFEGIITPLPLALGESTGLSRMVLSNLVPGRAFNYLQNLVGEGFPTEKIRPEDTREQAVLLQTLENAVTAYRLPFPTHAKIDVDGFELPLLRGAQSIFKDPRFREIHLESDRSDSDVLEFLKSLGFSVVRESPRGGTTVNLRLVKKESSGGAGKDEGNALHL